MQTNLHSPPKISPHQKGVGIFLFGGEIRTIKYGVDTHVPYGFLQKHHGFGCFLQMLIYNI